MGTSGGVDRRLLLCGLGACAHAGRAAFGLVVISAVLAGGCSRPADPPWRVVGKNEKHASVGFVRRFGYLIEERHSPGWPEKDAFRVTLYGSTFSTTLNASPKWRLSRIVNQDWLCRDSVISITVAADYVDSGDSQEYLHRILYDFRRGQLYTFSGALLWRIRYSEGPPWTEEDFDRKLAEIRTGCRGL